MHLNDRLNQSAQHLQDEKLLAKLSVWDAVAQELRCHAGCLTVLYNRERSALKKNQTDDEENLAVRKTDNPFSNIAIDQAHERNNAVVKDDGGAIGLTEDPSALRRWMVAGPEICRLVE